MTDSTFNPDAILDEVTTQAATRRPPLPGGEEFLATLGPPKVRSVQGKKDPTQTYTFLDVPCQIDVSSNPRVREYPQPLVTLTWSTGLHFTSAGSLDYSPGKNPGLRRLREALGQNEDGKAFSLRSGIEGRQVRVMIKQEEYEGEIMDRIDTLSKPS